MPVKLVYERPDIHREYSAVENITMELGDERTLEEMREGFDDFLKAVGFHIPLDEDGGNPLEENYQPLMFEDMSSDTFTITGIGDINNEDLFSSDGGSTFAGGHVNVDVPFTINLDDTYGATTTKLKDD